MIVWVNKVVKFSKTYGNIKSGRKEIRGQFLLQLLKLGKHCIKQNSDGLISFSDSLLQDLMSNLFIQEVVKNVWRFCVRQILQFCGVTSFKF